MSTDELQPEHPSDAAILGIERFFTHHVPHADHQAFVVCCESQSATIANWLLTALKVAGKPFRWYLFRDRDEAKFARELRQRVDELRALAGVERVAVLVCERDNLSFSHSLGQLRDDHTLTIRRLLGFSKELFELAFNSPPRDLRAINAGLLTRLIPARSLHISSALGTEMDIELNSDRYKWVSNHGVPAPGELLVFPAGEVNTFPEQINGRFVARGALNFNCRVDFDVRLADHPVTIDIKDCHARAWQCDDPQVQAFLNDVFAQPHATRIGELGIGTNIGIHRWVAHNSHINERRAGVHLGFGEHGQPGIVGYQAMVHLDVISEGEELEIRDGGPTIDTGRFAPGDVAHPAGTHSEDVEHGSWRNT